MQPHELNDIIEASEKNNPVAQEKLYKHFFALMYTICKKYTDDRQTTMSLVNEGFLKIFCNLKNFDSQKGNFEGWAKRIMTNTCIDFYRAKKNKHKSLSIDESNLNDKNLNQMPASYVEEEVLLLIKKLPTVTQKVFSMHVFKGYSHREIAQILDMAEATSRWHVSEARKKLKTQVHNIM